MSVFLKTQFLLCLLAIATLPLNLVGAQSQALPPIALAADVEPDPATDADFYLDKAAAKIAEIQTFVESIRDTSDLRQYPFRPVFFSKRDIEQTRHTLGLAKTQIDQLSDDVNTDRLHRHRRLSRRTERLGNYLTMIRTSLQASLNPSAFPDLKADAVRFRGLGMMLANIDSFGADPELAAIIVKQLPAAQQEVSRIATKYDLLVRQETIAGLQLAGLRRYFESKRRSFEAIVKQQRLALPGRIKGELADLQKALLSRSERRLSTSQESSPDKKTIELRSQLLKIEADLKSLEAINPQSSAFLLAHRKQLLNLRAAVQKTEPADRYTGDDRDDFAEALSAVVANLEKNQLRIPAKGWTRRTYWKLDNGQWVEVDQSVLKVYVFTNDPNRNVVTWRRFVFTKDHLNGDKLTLSLPDFK